MIAFKIWPIAIYWYGIFYAISFLLGYFYVKKLALKYLKLSNFSKFLEDLLFFSILGVLIWGRLWHVFFYEFSYFVQNPLKIFAVWEWWMAFVGGFIWVAISLYFLARKYKINYFKLTDLIVSFAPFWIWLGRIGNYLNQELYWKECPGFLLWTFLCNNFWTDKFYIANQLLEAFFEGFLLFAIFQYLVWKKNILNKPGLLTCIFVICYSFARFLLEFVRLNPQDCILYFGLSISQYFMILFFLVWLVLIYTLLKR